MTDTIPDPEIQRILSTATTEEERHVEFGERETIAWLRIHPQSRRLLLGLALVQTWALRFLKRFIVKKLSRKLDPSHPVMSRFGPFYDHVVRCFEIRIERLGLSSIPLSRLGLPTKIFLVGLLPFRMLWGRLQWKTPPLTDTYLEDPSVKDSISLEKSSGL